MDLKTLKRKELQALCKKHGIPANSTSSQMIESLSSILENHDKVKHKGCLKGSGGGSSEDFGVVEGNLKKKVTFVVEDEEDDEVKEIAINPIGNSKRKSVANEVVGIERRSTRSRGLSEAVLWSPVIEKTTKKCMSVGTEGVRRNDKPILSEVPTTRSLRNRVVVVGGEEESVTDPNSRRTQKGKISDKKDEKEMMASKLEGDEFVGRKNLRKRSRGGDFVGDEAPNRTSSRNHVKSEENLADLEEVDVGRSMKRRKRETDSLPTEEGADVNVERANRTKAMVVNSNAMESGDVKNGVGQKKVQGRVKIRASKRGGSTTLRSTHNSSLVRKPDEEIEAVKKEKLQKHEKGGADYEFVSEPVRGSTLSFSASWQHGSSLPVAGLPVEGAKGHGSKGGEVVTEHSRRSTRSSSVVGKSDEEGRASKKGRSQKGGLLDSEVIAEPIKRSTRASSTLQEDGASLLVANSVSVGEVVEESKSQKQAKGHGSKGGGSTTSLRDSETIAEPVRISTHSSPSLLETGTSSPVIETVKEVKSQKRGKGRALKVQAAPLSDNEASPTWISIRSSSKLLEDKAHLSEVEILSGDEEAIKNKKPGNQHRVHASKLGDPTAFLPENEAVTEPEMRSTCGSPKLLVDETSSPIVKANTATRDHASKTDDHATATSARRSTHSSSKLLKEGSVPNIETIGSGNEVRTNKSGNRLKNFDLIASVPDNEPVTTPSRILTQSSSKLLGKKSRNSASKEGDPTAMVAESPVVSKSVRRSARSSLKHISLEVETSSPVERKKTRKDQREDDLEGQRSEIRAQTKSLEEHEHSKELLRRSLRSTSKKNVLGGDEVEGPKSDGAISVSDPLVAGISFDLSIDAGSGNAETEFNDAVDKNVHEIRQSLAKVEEDTSLVGDIPISGNQSSGFELANKESGALLVNEGSSEIEENFSKLFPVEPSTNIEVNSEPAAPSKISIELSAAFDTEISTMAHAKEPDSMVKVGVEPDNVITGCEMMHVSSSQVPKSLEELSLKTDSHTSQGIDLDERLEAEIRGVIFDPLTSDTKVCSDSPTCQGADLEEPRLKPEICGANEDGLQDNEETDILVQAAVCKISEELTVANPEIDLKEPDSKVEVDYPSEDIIVDNEEKKILIPTTSDTEVCAETLCDAIVVGSDSKVEVHDASEGDMEQNEATTAVSSVMICKSTGILSPTSLNEAFPHSDLGQVDISTMNKDASHSEGSLPEASDIRCKTLEVSMTVDGNPGDASSPQTIFDNEMENCKANPGIISKSHREHRECDSVANIEAVTCDKYPQLNEDWEIMKGTWASSTVSHTVNDGTEIDNDRKYAEKNENEPRSSLPMESHAVERTQSSSEELFDTEVCSDSHTSQGTDLDEPRLKPEICGANDDDLQDNEETDIVVQTSVCKSSEELMQTSDTVANPEIDLEEPDSKVDVDHPSEDIMGDDEAKNIFVPMTSDTEVCAETLCNINVVGSDSKVEVHDASEGDMEENEATTTVSLVMSCKSTAILLPTSLNEASPHSDLGQVDIPTMNKEASHSDGSLPEASYIRCKTLEVSMTVDGNPGDTSSPQTIFDNEMENCKASPDIILKSHLECRECDIVNNVEGVTRDKYPQLHEDLEVMKETWVSMTVSVPVNDGTEIDNDRKYAEKNDDEQRSSLPMESHAVEGTQSSSEELVDAEQSDFTRSSSQELVDAGQSDFTHSLYEKESGDAEKKMRVSFDDEFSTENNDSLMSPVALMKYDGTSYATPLERNDEPSAFEIAEVSAEITEDKYSVEHRGPSQLLDASRESEKQMEDFKLCDADVESEGYSASSNENTSLSDTVRFGDVKKLVDQGDLPTLPVTFTGGEEMPLSGTEAPTLSANEGLTMQVDMQGSSYIHDNEYERNLSDHQEVTVNVTENLCVDIVHRSSKSAAKKHVDVEPLNVHSDALPENSIIVNKFTDVEFERTTILSAVVSQEMDNIGSLESEVNAEGYDGTKADNIEPDKVDLLDDVGQERDKASLLQEIKHFSGELHTDENASHISFNNSASESAEGRVLLAEKISPSTCLKNSLSLPKADIVLPHEAQLDEDSSEKTSAEDDTWNSEEFLSNSNFIPLADRQECQDNNLEEHAVDNDIDMSLGGMDRYFEVLDEESNKFRGTYESFFSGTHEGFEQASNDEECVEHCEAVREKSFHTNDEAAASMNENVEVGEHEHCEENLGRGRWEEFSEMDSGAALAVGEDEVKGVAELSPSECENFSIAESFSSASPKTFAGLDTQEQNKQNTYDEVEDGNECAWNPSYYQKF